MNLHVKGRLLYQFFQDMPLYCGVNSAPNHETPNREDELLYVVEGTLLTEKADDELNSPFYD